MSPKPGHELHKQLVELAFHVKKIGYKSGIRIIIRKRYLKTAIMFIPTYSPYAMNVTLRKSSA